MANYSLSDRRAMRQRALASQFNKIDRILTGDRTVGVTVIDDPKNTDPAWSVYPQIIINAASFENFTTSRGMVQLFGANYHELCHIMFTPRRKQDWVPHPLLSTFNILEDQRIESLFTAIYKPAGKYFTEMVVRIFVEQENQWASAFAYTYGRSYLPLEIRQEFEARYTQPGNIEEMKELIDRFKNFRSYHFKSKRSIVVQTVRRFKELLDELRNQEGNEVAPDEHQESDQDEGAVNEDLEKSASDKERKQREKEERTGEDQSNFWDEDEEDENDDSTSDDEPDGDEPGDEDEGSDGDEDGDSGNDSDSPRGDESPSDDGGDGDDEGPEEGNGGSNSDAPDEEGDEDLESASHGSTAGSAPGDWDDEDMRQYLEEVQKAVEDDESVKNEVRQILNTVNDPSNLDALEFVDYEGLDQYPVTAPMQQTVAKLSHEFRRMWADVEPGWEYGSSHGRLNIGRAIQDPENYEEMFDEWDEGRQQDLGLEVVLLADISGSMGYTGLRIPTAQAIWCLKRALEEIEAKVTVIGFDVMPYGLYEREQKFSRATYPLQPDGGGTAPAYALTTSRRLLNASSEPNKMLVVLTDGEWGYTDYTPNSGMAFVGWAGAGDDANLTELVESIPAYKMYVGVGKGLDAQDNAEEQKKFDSSHHFTNPLDLVQTVNKAVTHMLAQRM